MTNAIISAEMSSKGHHTIYLFYFFNIISFYILLGISDYWSVLRLYFSRNRPHYLIASVICYKKSAITLPIHFAISVQW